MDIVLLETAIVERLKEKIPGVDVRAFPGEPEEFAEVPVQQELLLVMYRGTSYERITQGPVGEAVAARHEFVISVLRRDLRDHSQAYTALANVRLALNGWEPIEGAPMDCVSEGRAAIGESGIWLFGAVYQVEDLNDPELG